MAIASSKVSNTEWVQLKGKFTSPDDATALSLYVESTKPTESFYIDNVVMNRSPPLLNNINVKQGLVPNVRP